jgi:mono/diheme cytochrome c family protein
LLLAAVANASGAPAARDGEQLYLRQCAPCHGKTGTGDGPDAPYYSASPRNLRDGFLDRYSTAALVLRIREGRSLPLAVDPKALKKRTGEAASLVDHLKRLPSIDWRQVDEGWGLYVDRCESCHGPYGSPGTSLPAGVRPPRDLSDPSYQRSLSDADLLAAVRHGRRHMPALVPRVPEKDGPLLASFVRVLSPGFQLYSRHCAACHGDDGRGVGSLIETLGVPTVVFDEAYFRSHDPDRIRRSVWHMVDQHKPAMPHFRWDLSEPEARAIVEYLKKTAPQD